MLAGLLNQYHSNIQAAICFLHLLKVKVNNSTVYETFQNHPNWASLLCTSDALNKCNISNAAGKIDSKEIDQLLHVLHKQIAETKKQLFFWNSSLKGNAQRNESCEVQAGC